MKRANVLSILNGRICLCGHSSFWPQGDRHVRSLVHVCPGDDPTYEKLDRVLVSTKWEDKFPLATVQTRDRNISDHTPLILNTGSSTHQNKQPTFKFERGWLIRDGFFDMVAKLWQSETSCNTALEKCRIRLDTWDSILGVGPNIQLAHKKRKTTTYLFVGSHR